MAHSPRFFAGPVCFATTLALVALAMASCASEEGTGVRPRGGGSGATGGAGGTGPATGGTGPATGGGTGTCPGPASLDPSGFPPCTLCEGSAHCVPSAAVPPNFVDQLQDCPDAAGSKCVPDDLIATAGQFLFKTCTSLLNAEGRCVPTCIKQVASQKDRLPVDVCQASERCAPCFDPTTGQPTGACNAGCDTGPVNPTPVTFSKCCSDLGSCVPRALVPTELQSSLGQDSCTDATTLCAPNTFIGTTGSPIVCQSLLVQDGKYAEGRCVPTCVPQVQRQANQLPQDVCAAGEKCAPCYNPIDGVSTGSCTAVSTDQPTQPALEFADCCMGHGKCVPKALAGAAGANLPPQECTGADFVCAPLEKVNDINYKFPACTSLTGPGACIFPCFAGANAAILQPGPTCTGGTVCAPCTNPLDGTVTGACT